jgi:CRISPR-associated exonuclease Cas4
MIANVLVGLLAIASLLGVACSLSKRRRAGPALVNLPRELRDAQLLYAEQLFAAKGRLSISARVDRAYRMRSGVIVLLELKTREKDRPYFSDVIELSAQRAAIALQTGEKISDHAYVAVRRPGSASAGTHRVQLMPIAEVLALAVRRETILLGRLAPSYAGSAEICRRCAFASGCERFKDGGLRKYETQQPPT